MVDGGVGKEVEGELDVKWDCLTLLLFDDGVWGDRSSSRSGVQDPLELKDTLSALLAGLRSSVPEPTEHSVNERTPVNTTKATVNASGLSYEHFAASVDDQHYEQRARYIPLRMTEKERSMLRIVEAALDVSEYTDRVDVFMYSKARVRVPPPNKTPF